LAVFWAVASAERPLIIGRYTLAAPVGAGGMATIYLGRQVGAAGFSRVIAVKRLHPHYANEPEFIGMFLDEARLAARVRHPHVVETLDVVHEDGETVIVLEYVDGESLAGLARALYAAGERMPLAIAGRVMMEACLGLHAAHEAKGSDGMPLGIVHRDVSPANVLVGTDGASRVTDFGIALASNRLSHTKSGQVKGKPAYMAPEQLAGRALTRASDIYAAGVVLWELCAGRRAYEAPNEGALYAQVLAGQIPHLAEVAPWVPAELVRVVDRALERDPARRFGSALEMALAIERALPIAAPAGVGAFVEQRATEALGKRRRIAATLDQGMAPRPSSPAPAPAPEPVDTPSRPPMMRDDTQRRITHTLTAQSPSPPARNRFSVLGLVLAVTVAALLSGGAVWLFTRQSQPSPAARTTAVAGLPSIVILPTSEATASATSEPEIVEPASSETAAPTSDVPSSSAASPSDKMLPRRPGAGSASLTSPKCDPPYFIDAQGIQRVKRDCF
jgi:hypothetical protein